MMIFALCLLAAGALLSILTRVHGLLTVAIGVVAAVVLVVLLRLFGAGSAYPLGITLLVAIVSLQVGYGLGVIAQAILGPRLRRPAGSTPGATAPDTASAQGPERSLSRKS